MRGTERRRRRGVKGRRSSSSPVNLATNETEELASLAMNDEIEYHADLLAGRVRELLARPPVYPSERRKIPPVSGVYLFSELGEGHLYVGVATTRTNHLRARIGQHIPRPPARPRKATAATLAERIAMEGAGLSSRKGLYDNEEFCELFWALGPRIEHMDLRFIEVDDPAKARAMERFAVWVLSPRYNY